ncbi:uncharacterized protein METZ01_LOCUS262550 [marine metagenome]|uniref:Uncharacterized protein n=1 Tax=marine metagenome TaxID=408172 RepID=A0A382JCT3_9ZZZZ
MSWYTTVGRFQYWAKVFSPMKGGNRLNQALGSFGVPDGGGEPG